MSANNDGSESVDQFLARIASVKDGRDEESERKRRMEEEFLKNRSERQARRLERARSISPSKTGPSRPISSATSTAQEQHASITPPINFSPRSTNLSRSGAVRTSPTLEPKHFETVPTPASIHSSPSSPSNTPTLARSATLSWQQRPAGRATTLGRARPLSTIATARPASLEHQDRPSSPKEQSREEIAASLSQKDASWFRQTQDRAASSAAYRKNQVEDTPIVEPSMRSMRLPGMFNDVRSSDQSPTQSERSPPRSRLSPEQAALHNASTPAAQSPPVVSYVPQSPKHGKPIASEDDDRIVDGRNDIVQSRSPSPTKGLGGFVQSAMMRRSDSVSKRWSVQANAGLRRGDSRATARPLSGLNLTQKPSPPPLSSSKVESGNLDAAAGPEASEDSTKPTAEITSKPATGSARPTTPPESRETNQKALESKRWSPTKSSWLESTLLSKQEPPNPVARRDEQPQWMINLQRSKSIRELSPGKTSSGVNQKDSINAASADKESGVAEEKIDDVPAVVEDRATKGTDSKDTSVESQIGRTSEKLHERYGKESPAQEQPAQTQPVKATGPNIAAKKPAVLASKPATPPKPDLRATLRARAAPAGGNQKSEPEFKSMFGKLKPAQTKNYVAPDTFKHNILSGKAALSLTGGPQKSQHVDEFKESILQKKETMKANALDRKHNESPIKELEKPDVPLPEALQRRKTLHRASPSITKLQGEFSLKDGPLQTNLSKPVVALKAKPEALSVKPASRSIVHDQSQAEKSHVSSYKPSTEAITAAWKDSPRDIESEKISGSAGSETSLPSEPGVRNEAQQRAPKPNLETKPVARSPDGKSSTPTVSSQSVSASPIQNSLPQGSKLASRLNPSLAALISRGGKPAPTSETTAPLDDSQGKNLSRIQSPSDEHRFPTAELTHMTKGRAKGPRRRAPKAQETTSPNAISLGNEQKSTASAVLTGLKGISRTEASVTPSEPMSDIKSKFTPIRTSVEPRTASLKTNTNSPSMISDEATPIIQSAATGKNDVAEKPMKAKPKPVVAVKSPDLRKVSNTQDSKGDGKGDGLTFPKTSVVTKFEIVADKPAQSEPQSASSTLSRTAQSPAQSDLITQPLTPNKSRVNTPKQPPPEKPTSSKPVIQSPTATTGSQASSVTQRNETKLKAALSTSRPEAKRISPVTAAAASTAGVAELVDHYFQSGKLSSSAKLDCDTQALLQRASEIHNNESEKIRTLSNTIWEVSTDGKKTAMPPQQEHILYEECMYLMIHIYEVTINQTQVSKSSDVQLWVGDRVPDAATDDVQLFCKKDAREQGTKLDVIRQGKEPSRFFQALGGIVITRRSKSSALYMLCGRKHLGHIAFDEVDFAPTTLCSGFPYLISAKFGSLYLWKGMGSAVDEVGCARLIGMDLGLTGEIEEVDEGQEPPAFWDAFTIPGSMRVGSLFWQERSHREHAAYPCSMYRVEQERPKSAAGGFWGLRSASPPKASSGKMVAEMVSPYCQTDVQRGQVCVLDVYRTIYVLLNVENCSKAAECVAAMHFAQEIAMLSPAAQGRSILPTCHVVFGEPPGEVQGCFRKWTSSNSTSAGTVTGKSKPPTGIVRLEDVMQVLAP